MNLSKFVEYVKVHAVWKNKPDKSTPVNADALMTIESGIKSNNEAISELAAAVVSEIANDPNKIANMAALYAVQQAAFPKANLVNQIVNDATKAASAAALYSVNETLKQTNSNFKSQTIAGISLTVPAQSASFVAAAIVPNGYRLVGARFEYSSTATSCNLSAPMVLNDGLQGCRILNNSTSAVNITGAIHYYYLRAEAINK